MLSPMGESRLQRIDLLHQLAATWWFLSVRGPLSGVLQTVALTGCFQDVTVVSQAIEEGTRQSLTAEHLGPLFERQVGRYDDAGPFISSRDHVE